MPKTRVTSIADYNQAIHLDAKDDAAYYNRGIAEQMKSDFDGAIVDYNQAIELNPTLAEAYYNRGLVKQTKNDLDGAIADFNHNSSYNRFFISDYELIENLRRWESKTQSNRLHTSTSFSSAVSSTRMLQRRSALRCGASADVTRVVMIARKPEM